MRKIRAAVVRWIWFHQDQWPDRLIDSRAYELTFRLIAWLGCALAGHEPTVDQCLMPEHDFCLWCQKPQPGLAPRRPDRRHHLTDDQETP